MRDMACGSPDVVMLELTNACNFSCVMCGNRTMTRPKGFMSKDVFTRALDAAEETSVPRVKLYTVGESLLHPHFIDMWRLAVQRSFKAVMISTNGALLNETLIDELVASKKLKVQFSFSRWDKRSYETVYEGGVFEKAVAVLRRLRERMTAAGLPNVALVINGMILQPEDGERCRAFLKNEIGVDDCQIALRPPQKHAGFGERQRTAVGGRPLYCGIIDKRIGILYDGRVTACGCLDFNGDLVCGNIMEKTIKDIREGRAFEDILEKFRSANVLGLICAQCTACKPQRSKRT